MFASRGGFFAQPLISGYTEPGDYADDADTKLLLKFESNFNDTVGSGRVAKTMQTADSPSRSASFKKFGSEGLSIVASISILPRVFTTTTHSDFQWYSQDFTAEAWAYVDSFSDHTFFSGSNQIGKIMGSTSGNDYGWSLGFLSDAKLAFWYWNGSSGSTVVSPSTFATGTWHHIMMDYRHSDGRIRLGANGVFVNSGTKVGSPVVGNTFTVGSVRLNSPQFYLDNLRISHTLRYP
jgi:hypothetical protein